MASNEDNFEQIMAEIEAEEKGSKVSESTEKKEEVEKSTKKIDEVGKTQKEEEKSSSSLYAHEEILKEEGLTKDDMPADIRKMIITFERKKRMAESSKASEATMLKIQNLSTLIADQIISYLESDETKHEQIKVEKMEEPNEIMEDGGGIEDIAATEDGGMDDGADDSIIEDGGDFIDDGIDDLEDGGEASGEEVVKKTGMFDGLLGGIFNWND